MALGDSIGVKIDDKADRDLAGGVNDVFGYCCGWASDTSMSDTVATAFKGSAMRSRYAMSPVMVSVSAKAEPAIVIAASAERPMGFATDLMAKVFLIFRAINEWPTLWVPCAEQRLNGCAQVDCWASPLGSELFPANAPDLAQLAGKPDAPSVFHPA